ncbi:DUF4355 domain-containing protein [Weissella confusa]|uniref:DUF4355 domain-containing protein n=1 Tax=Weissella confusa TaxID=1583 RepID=UPI001C6F69D1|nr:DUF4355 domain-containing protein [Weissella confusa]QYU58203.1 DUF4355 domain-containing protein [Weissella confusa]
MDEEIKTSTDGTQVDGDKKEPDKKADGDSEKTFTRDDISKMMAAERAKWEEEAEERIEREKSEAERLAKLSKTEREEAEAKKREEELAKREQAVKRSELKIETREQLRNSGLPVEFADIVMADEAEQIQENIKAVKTTFDEAVERLVNERLAQGVPRNGSGKSGAMDPFEAKLAKYKK